MDQGIKESPPNTMGMRRHGYEVAGGSLLQILRLNRW
jgi:hypothetical protein